jgi:CBS domain-containing protein
VRDLTCERISCDVADISSVEAAPPGDAILLRDHVLDKKVLDLEDNEVEIVYDISLVLLNARLYVTEVDTSRYARLRRMGLGPVANLVFPPGHEERDQTIPWTYVQPLPSNIGSFRGDIKLRVLREKLSKIHPVDLADILEELDHDQRVLIFSELDHEQASDTLEEIEPTVQRDIVSSLNRDKVVALINEMTPGQAADLLSVLPRSDVQGILEAMNPDNARKVGIILEKQEEKVIHFTTQKFMKMAPDLTVGEVQNDYPASARGKDVIMYLYVVDERDVLIGVIDLKELLQADDTARLREIMVDHVIALKPGSTLKEASDLFARYDFRALPVTGEDDRILGVIPYRDVMNLTHHFLE